MPGVLKERITSPSPNFIMPVREASGKSSMPVRQRQTYLCWWAITPDLVNLPTSFALHMLLLTCPPVQFMESGFTASSGAKPGQRMLNFCFSSSPRTLNKVHHPLVGSPFPDFFHPACFLETMPYREAHKAGIVQNL